jgi:small subunit ribosomal protein S7
MPRNYKSTAALLRPDPKFNSMLATKIINKIMLSGKRSDRSIDLLRSLGHGAQAPAGHHGSSRDLQQGGRQRATDGRSAQQARRRRQLSGAARSAPQSPAIARDSLVDRQRRKKKGKPMAKRLAEELADACQGTGASVQWKENVHKMAEANKAYSHYAN